MLYNIYLMIFDCFLSFILSVLIKFRKKHNVLCDYLNRFILFDVDVDGIVVSSKNLHRIQQDIVSEREP